MNEKKTTLQSPSTLVSVRSLPMFISFTSAYERDQSEIKECL